MMLTAAEAAEETWDHEWSFEDGLLENNGWTKVINGNASASLISTGLKMMSNGYAAYICYEKKDAKKQIGVMEAVFSIHLGGAAAGGHARFCFSNGTKGIQLDAVVSTNAPDTLDFYILDADDIKDRTLLAPFVSDQEYTARCVLDGNVGRIYIDGVLLADNVDISTVLYSARTAVWWQGGTYNANYLMLRSVKLKYNRT